MYSCVRQYLDICVGKPHAETALVRGYEEVCQASLVYGNEHEWSTLLPRCQDDVLAGGGLCFASVASSYL